MQQYLFHQRIAAAANTASHSHQHLTQALAAWGAGRRKADIRNAMRAAEETRNRCQSLLEEMEEAEGADSA